MQHVIKEIEGVNGGLRLRGEWKQITMENNKRELDSYNYQHSVLRRFSRRFSVSLVETEPLGWL